MFSRYVIVAAALLLGAACSAQEASPAAAWTQGKNYFVIDPALPTTSGKQIEVTEVFSYACPHCAHFQPYAEQIKQSLPDYATYTYMPAVFWPQWEPFARAYYASQSLGVLDKTHQALFDALHRDHKPIHSIDDLAKFYSGYGIKPKVFISEAKSFEVESKLARAQDWERKAGVDGTPTIVVNGKYRITVGSAGGYPQLIRLVDWLVAKEHKASASG